MITQTTKQNPMTSAIRTNASGIVISLPRPHMKRSAKPASVHFPSRPPLRCLFGKFPTVKLALALALAGKRATSLHTALPRELDESRKASVQFVLADGWHGRRSEAIVQRVDHGQADAQFVLGIGKLSGKAD